MMKTKHLGAMFAAAALAAVAYADVLPTIDLTFAPGDTLAYSHDGCEPVRIDLDGLSSPVTFELGRDGHYVFYSNGVVTAKQDVSELGTKVTEPNWATVPVTFTLDTKVDRTFDLSGGVVTTNLTYSGTGWDEPGAGTSATITCVVGGQETTLADGLTGAGEIEWKLLANGIFTLKHTSGDATETATITIENLTPVTITVGNLEEKHLTGKVVWNGTETEVEGASFELPKGGKDAKLVLTAESGYRPDGSLGTASLTEDGRWMVEVSLDDLIAEGGTVSIADDIPAAKAYGVLLRGVTNRYPWNGKIDVVASVAGLDTTKYYSLVTTLTLDGTTKRVKRELGAGKDATYTNTIDCAELFGKEFVGEVSVKLSLKEYEEREIGVVSVVKVVDLTKGEYLIINLDDWTSVETTLGDYLKTDPNAWSLGDGWAEDYKTKYLVMRKVEKGNAYPCDPRQTTSTNFPTQATKTPNVDYWIGVHQVTVAQYERVVNNNFTSTEAKPKISISWNEIRGNAGITAEITKDSAKCFMQQLCEKTNLAGFDLPTEAQWEIAARAGSKEEYGSYVDEYGGVQTATKYNLANIAWFDKSVNSSPITVGQLRPNLWGLYDTLGNVWEWCRDSSSGEASNVETPAGDSSDERVIRGGCCISDELYCRPSGTNNGHAYADSISNRHGFRLSRICNPDAK